MFLELCVRCMLLFGIETVLLEWANVSMDTEDIPDSEVLIFLLRAGLSYLHLTRLALLVVLWMMPTGQIVLVLAFAIPLLLVWAGRWVENALLQETTKFQIESIHGIAMILPLLLILGLLYAFERHLKTKIPTLGSLFIACIIFVCPYLLFLLLWSFSNSPCGEFCWYFARTVGYFVAVPSLMVLGRLMVNNSIFIGEKYITQYLSLAQPISETLPRILSMIASAMLIYFSYTINTKSAINCGDNTEKCMTISATLVSGIVYYFMRSPLQVYAHLDQGDFEKACLGYFLLAVLSYATLPCGMGATCVCILIAFAGAELLLTFRNWMFNRFLSIIENPPKLEGDVVIMADDEVGIVPVLLLYGVLRICVDVCLNEDWRKTVPTDYKPTGNCTAMDSRYLFIVNAHETPRSVVQFSDVIISILLQRSGSIISVLSAGAWLAIVLDLFGAIFDALMEASVSNILGLVCGLQVILFHFQVGLFRESCEERGLLLMFHIISQRTTIIHFVHSWLQPRLMTLGTSAVYSLQHFKTLVFCALELVFLFTVLWCLKQHLNSNVFLAQMFCARMMVSITIDILQLISFLAKYALFMVDSRYDGLWLGLDDCVYCINVTYKLAAYVHTVVDIFGGVCLLVYESRGSLYATYMFAHAYINLWCEAREAWRVYMERRASVKEIHTLQIATRKELCDYEDVCAICQCDMTTAKVTRCRHLFHESCLRRWLYQKGTCPMCREPIFLKERAIKTNSFVYVDNFVRRSYSTNTEENPQI